MKTKITGYGFWEDSGRRRPIRNAVLEGSLRKNNPPLFLTYPIANGWYFRQDN